MLDILYDELTVQEHLELIAKVREKILLNIQTSHLHSTDASNG